MALDDRTPVIVGVAQVSRRPADAEEAVHSLDLMAEAGRLALEDSQGRTPFGGVDSLRVVESLGWKAPDPAALVAARLGLEPRDRVVTATGGNGPLSLLHETCQAIRDGHLDSALLTGAEALYSRRLVSKAGGRVVDPDPAPASGEPRLLGDPALGSHPLELEAGLALPVHLYPLFSTALAIASAESPHEHRRRCGRLWSRFSEVASANPYAWQPEALSAGEIAEPSDSNRMVSFPYTKRLCANIQVDQAAAVVVMSVAAARSRNISPSRWAFPWAGAEALDRWFVSRRRDLHRSPAISAAWGSLAGRLGVETGELDHIDLYSCFPSAVLVAARELALDETSALTLTGGLTFAGGPGNNYSMHSLATLVERLRADGGAGLVTGVGWYLTKHAMTVVGAEPGPAFTHESLGEVGDELDEPSREVEPVAGQEAFTVLYDRDGEPTRSIVAARTDERRLWLTSSDPGVARALESGEQVLAADGTFA
jgi:acetyl-CoA C-acetyltransferase